MGNDELVHPYRLTGGSDRKGILASLWQKKLNGNTNSFFAKKNKTVNYWEVFWGKYFVIFLQLRF
jgi:hypothetical protein